MKLNEIGEFGFIDRISKKLMKYNNNLVIGIGDDCSVFKLKEDSYGLITTDLLIENVHFLLNKITPEDLGYKSLAVNLSDIAAMGGTPVDAYISIAVPENITVEYLDKFYKSIANLSEKYKINIAGGDTTHSKKDLVISITVFGTSNKPVLRKGANIGDKIYLTGYVGDSPAGLFIMLNDFHTDRKTEEYLIKAHNRPEPMVNEGKFLASSNSITSMIDLSDGIASDLNHICKYSRTGAVLFENMIPLSTEFQEFLKYTSQENFILSLTGGEDYQLLFTVNPGKSDLLEKEFENKFKKKIYYIGEIVEGSKIFLEQENGKKRILTKRGYDHFQQS